MNSHAPHATLCAQAALTSHAPNVTLSVTAASCPQQDGSTKGKAKDTKGSKKEKTKRGN